MAGQESIAENSLGSGQSSQTGYFFPFSQSIDGWSRLPSYYTCVVLQLLLLLLHVFDDQPPGMSKAPSAMDNGVSTQARANKLVMSRRLNENAIEMRTTLVRGF